VIIYPQALDRARLQIRRRARAFDAGARARFADVHRPPSEILATPLGSIWTMHGRHFSVSVEVAKSLIDIETAEL
jgi:hypothetical protein